MSRFGNMRNSNALTAFFGTMRMSFACRLADGVEELLKEILIRELESYIQIAVIHPSL